MSIVIRKIQFVNFRQYGTGVINFKSNSNCNLYGFVAKNGTGKTTLLNAITWCLYENEQGKNKTEDALPVVSSAVVKNAEIEDFIDVSVTVEIRDNDETIEFKRTKKFRKKGENEIDVIDFNSTFEVVTVAKGSFTNPVKHVNEEADMLVKKYFDEAIYDFYFFDGEKLQDFFSASRYQYLKNSIQNISQLTLIKNAYKRIVDLAGKKKNEVGKGAPALDKLYRELADIEDKLNNAKKTVRESSNDMDLYGHKIDEIEQKLKEYKPIKEQNDKRIEYEHQLKKLEEDKKKLIEDKHKFIRKYIILAKLYPRIIYTLNMIREKEKQGKLPPAIDKKEIEKILENPNCDCPVCKRRISSDVVEHLRKLLLKLEVSSATSNHLMEIKGSLEERIKEVQQYKKERELLIEREKHIVQTIADYEEKLQQVNVYLSNYSNTDGVFDVKKAEESRGSYKQRYCAAIQNNSSAKNSIKFHEQDMKKKQAEIDDENKKIVTKNKAMKQLEVLNDVAKHFNTIIQNVSDNTRREIEDSTWNIFRNMIWKKNTFGKVEIGDNYSVKLYDKNGSVMTGSSSATETMALAYAFILAIHEASGKNCPLVIDSPLGRVSDENRKKMAEVLLEISREKQIIMLFTPDEYSSSVKKIYDNVATIKELKLTEDEEFVEGLDQA